MPSPIITPFKKLRAKHKGACSHLGVYLLPREYLATLETFLVITTGGVLMDRDQRCC